jgi:DNA-binding transcriptional MerR regulator/effector-binding domain-containing protein
VLTIGEFSHSVHLSIKTIRYYQELGILIPAETDISTGYRYFNEQNYERGQSIILLKKLGFTLKEIQGILKDCRDDNDLQTFIDKKLDDVERKLKDLKSIKKQLENQKRLSLSVESTSEEGIIEFDFELPCYAGEQIKGHYDQIGKGFSALYKKFGRFALGKPYTFYMDMEYREENARIEAVIELEQRAADSQGGINTFPKHRAVKMIHKGPYGSQGPVYVALFNYCRKQGYEIEPPIIEHFIKGPGMIFKGNPDLYETECIVLFTQ